MTFKGDALALANRALDLWGHAHPGESLRNQCQRFSGYYTQWAYQGNEVAIHGYDPAKAAAVASHIEGRNVNTAPVGAFVYWEIGTDWHIVQVAGHIAGRSVGVSTSAKGDVIKALRYGTKLFHLDTYPATVYGWSYTNGANPRMVGITAYPPVAAPVPPPVVKPPVVTPPKPPVVTPPPVVVPPTPPVVVTPPIVVPPPVVPPVIVTTPPIEPPVDPPIPAVPTPPAVIPPATTPESPTPWGWIVTLLVAVGAGIAAIITSLH